MAEGASKATEFLTKKAGPLPVGVWLVLVGGGLGVTYYLNRNKGGSAETGSGVVQPNPDATGMGTYVPTGGNAGSGGSGSANPPGFADNNEWGTTAINYLIGLGYDPGIANQAIALYLSSSPLTSQQQAMVNSALQKFGPPPLLPAPTIPKPGDGGSGSGGTMTAPVNLHVNKHGLMYAVVWDADKNTDLYTVNVKAQRTGKTFIQVAPGPHGVYTTGTNFAFEQGGTYDITVTPSNEDGNGPSTKITYKAA